MSFYAMLRCFYRNATGGKRHAVLMSVTAARSISSKEVTIGGGKSMCLACRVGLQL